MPPPTPLSNPEVFYNLAASIEAAAASALAGCEITPDTRIVGWNEPPEDCCGLAVWPDNLRHDPKFQVAGMDRAQCATAFLIDIHIRYSECFVDTYEDGTALPSEQLNDMSHDLYQTVFWCLYLMWWCRWVNGQIPELVDVCTPVSQGPLKSYASGGCAGGDFIVTVRLGQ